jgi:hypothetical protein
MLQHRARPKIIRILKTDVPARIALFLALLLWFPFLWTIMSRYMPEFFVRSSPFRGIDSREYLKSALYMTVLALPMLIIRIMSVLGMFKKGADVTGNVKVLRKRKTGGYFIYSYEFGGRTYQKTCNLNSSKEMQLYHEGGPVALKVDPKKPDHALVCNRFFL